MLYVCFLDLLGQRDFFSRINNDIRSSEVIPEIARISFVIESLANYAEGYIRKNLAGTAGVSIFSDSLVLWIDGDKKLDTWLRLIVKLVHISLRYFIPVRGAISCGTGNVDDNGMFAGVPLIEAIDAEANCSVYPRIILVGEMRKWLEDKMEREQNCDPRFAIDMDGHFALNYAGSYWLDDLAFSREKMHMENLLSWVHSEYCRFCYAPGDTKEYNLKKLKLVRKYVMWMDYLRRTLALQVEDINRLPAEFEITTVANGQYKWNVCSYVAFYIKIESPLIEVDDVKSWFEIDKLDKELSWSARMTDLLGLAIKDLDSTLRRVPSYLAEMKDVDVRVQRIGNYLLVYAPEERDVARSMYALMILRNAEFVRKLASRGSFVRGAFTRGIGWELSSEGGLRTLYGPVMAKAYNLMTNVAWRQRVVVDESIYQIIADKNSYGSDPDGSWLSLHAKRDFDGIGIVNYFAYDAEYAKAQPGKAKEAVDDLQKAYESANRCIKFMASKYGRHDYSAHVQQIAPLLEELSIAKREWTQGVAQLVV